MDLIHKDIYFPGFVIPFGQAQQAGGSVVLQDDPGQLSQAIQLFIRFSVFISTISFIVPAHKENLSKNVMAFSFYTHFYR